MLDAHGNPCRCEMSETQWDELHEAIEVVRKGLTKRVDTEHDIKVYRAGTVLRIDLKI